LLKILLALLNAASGGPLQGFNRVKFQIAGSLEHIRDNECRHNISNFAQYISYKFKHSFISMPIWAFSS
jgi:hypothetical protein